MNRQEATKIYKKYLTSQWPTWEGKMKPPVGNKLFTQMCAQTDNEIDKPSTIERALKSGRRVLWWSDQHFFHSNIIRYADRPYTDFDSMNDDLIKNYFNSVKSDDVVVWGGDCSFGSIETARHFLTGKNLPGYKILVLGNHDFDKNSSVWRELDIFQEIILCDGFTLNIDGVDKDIIVTHYPINKSLLSENTLNVHGHIHEGIDFYCEKGDTVRAMEGGIIVDIKIFTGPLVGSPWWNTTYCILVEGHSGVINYGEIIVDKNLRVGQKVKTGDTLGVVETVLKKNKGRPMNMLHLELYEPGTRSNVAGWSLGESKPLSLIDPTYLFLKFVSR